MLRKRRIPFNVNALIKFTLVISIFLVLTGCKSNGTSLKKSLDRFSVNTINDIIIHYDYDCDFTENVSAELVDLKMGPIDNSSGEITEEIINKDSQLN